MTKIKKEECVITTVDLMLREVRDDPENANRDRTTAVLDLPDAMSQAFGEIRLKLVDGSGSDVNQRLLIEIEEKGKIRKAMLTKTLFGEKKERIGGNNLDWPTFLSIKSADYDDDGKVVWATLYVCTDFYIEKETFADKLLNRINNVHDKENKVLSLRDMLERKKATAG